MNKTFIFTVLCIFYLQINAAGGPADEVSSLPQIPSLRSLTVGTAVDAMVEAMQTEQGWGEVDLRHKIPYELLPQLIGDLSSRFEYVRSANIAGEIDSAVKRSFRHEHWDDPEINLLDMVFSETGDFVLLEYAGESRPKDACACMREENLEHRFCPDTGCNFCSFIVSPLFCATGIAQKCCGFETARDCQYRFRKVSDLTQFFVYDMRRKKLVLSEICPFVIRNIREGKIVISPNGRYVARLTNTHMVSVFDTSIGKLVSCFDIRRYVGDISQSVQFSADGTCLIVGCNSGLTSFDILGCKMSTNIPRSFAPEIYSTFNGAIKMTENVKLEDGYLSTRGYALSDDLRMVASQLLLHRRLQIDAEDDIQRLPRDIEHLRPIWDSLPLEMRKSLNAEYPRLAIGPKFKQAELAHIKRQVISLTKKNALTVLLPQIWAIKLLRGKDNSSSVCPSGEPVDYKEKTIVRLGAYEVVRRPL